MKKEEIPAARLIRLADEMAKYKPAGEVLENVAEMRSFIDDFLAGKLKVILIHKLIFRLPCIELSVRS